MNILDSLELCRIRASAYLESQVEVINDAQYWRHSATHDPRRHPGHLLYGTWAGVLASVAIRRDRQFTPAVRRRIARALNAFQRPDGTYMLPDVPDLERGGHDEEYLALHCTNYAVGALQAIGEGTRHPLAFMHRYADAHALDAWLESRDWSRPWTEGNNVVNVASFLAIPAAEGDAAARARLEQIADWLDAHQNPETGFWHRSGGRERSAMWYAMAGAAHVLHVHYSLGRAVPHADRIVESCLRLGYPGIRSACLDIDLVDLLTHGRRCDHRVRDVDDVLERFLVELLQVQNADGGFCDSYVTPHRLYGHSSPADASVMWTTWFRLATIGMIATTLLPEQRQRWGFRNTMGSGYFNMAYALDGALAPTHVGRYLHPAERMLLAARRNGRFARQRATSRVRTLLRVRG